MRNLLLTTVMLIVTAQPLLAEELCVGGPRDQWLTEEAITSLVTEMGYSTDDFMLMVEDGCLEAKLIHDGKRIEVYFEPITGEVVRVKED